MLVLRLRRPLTRFAPLARGYARPGFLAPELEVDAVVVGGGVVVRHQITLMGWVRRRRLTLNKPPQGLAVGERMLQAFPERSTFVIER